MSPHISVLGNGLRVCAEAVPQYGHGLAAVALTVAAGSDDDPAGRHGTAHLVEQLMFPRAEPGPDGAGGHAALVEGAGGVCNAETHRDHTVFHTTVPAGLLPDVLAWEARRLRDFAPTDEVIRTETRVIGEEIRGAAGGGRVWDTVLAALYPGSRDSFGTAAELAGSTAREAVRFFRSHYTAPRIVLSVVGDIDTERVTAAAHDLFAPLAADAPASARRPYPGPAAVARTAPLPAAFPGAAVGHRLPDPVTERTAYLAQVVLAQLLGRSRLPALARSARDGHRLTSATVTCGYYGQWLTSAAPDLSLALLGRAPDTSVDEAVEVWRTVLREIADRPACAAEHRRAVNSLLVAWHRQSDSLTTRAVALGRAALFFAGSGGPDGLPAELSRVTPEQVAGAARALLDGPTTVTELVPETGQDGQDGQERDAA
ncbi:MAG: insulinase family protein [Kitasatospora sp.]|jgi:predicted Zn-dependent peptidase|nr:insulinase family protein [Kitasatospora sp.]